MASSSPFRSLDHAIDVAKHIFLNKLDVGCWLEALSYRDCFNTYITMATESTKQGLHKWVKIPKEVREVEEKYEDMSHGVETVTLNSDEVNSLGNDNATEFDTNNDPRKNVRGIVGSNKS
ncbi:hypothetical protein PIB30_058244 [Stylosanthes scabra]|uniref:Uncharacterized protein n=1 Tax=Stylosanthes scabra TaxID=79078 RepID=A0ABU6WN69_9FABA|nr:hypothetical protein [Stylosanthes scabra]